MKYQKKNLWVLALASVVSLLVASGCDDTDTTTTTTAANTLSIANATLWSKVDVGGGKVTQIVKSGTNTYAATSDKGLFHLKADGSWAAVDLATGKEPLAATAATLAGATEIKHLTALEGNRVIFAAVGKGVGIADGDKVTRAWLDAAAGANHIAVAADITSIVTIKGANDKENIVLAHNANEIALNLNSEDAAVSKVWLNNMVLANGAFNKPITKLVVNNDGTVLYVGQNAAPHGYYPFTKAQITGAGASTALRDAVTVLGKAAQTWLPTVLPDHAAFTSKGLVVGVATAVAFVPTANLAGGDNTKVTDATVNRFRKGTDVVNVLAKEGLFVVAADGKLDATKTFDGKFKGDNYESKNTAELAAMKKADLKLADLGTKDILDMESDGKTTYYVTDKGVWVGKTANITVKKD